jgi:hypothetical protein
MPQAVPGPEERNLSQLIQHALCRHQIAGFESFGEPIVDGRLQLAHLLGTAPLMPQPCKACGCSQLPRQGTLPARPIERVQKVLLGGRHGLRRTLPQDELTFDAQKLGDAPALLVALGAPERFAGYRAFREKVR